MNPGPWAVTARDSRTIVLLLFASLAAGLASNGLRPHPLPLVYVATPPVVEGSDLDLGHFEALVAAGEGLVLDARPELFHRVGHVPGALSLPREDFDAAYARLGQRLEHFRAGPIAVYCSDESCDDSRFVQMRLQRMGFRRVVVFPGGWDAWTNAGLGREVSHP